MQQAKQWTLVGLGVLLLAAGLSVGCGSSSDNSFVPLPRPPVDPVVLHQEYFTENAYTGTAQCLECHADVGTDILGTGHWNWEGVATNVEGYETGVHGKTDFINNFCIAIPTNEGRCTQCHIGYGWADDTFDFSDATSIDCLICHDQTGTYQKAKTTAGLPEPSVDLDAVAQSVGQNDGVPTRKACIDCHAKAGGGDNVKHGDLSTDLIATTRDFDVHMGTDGGNFSCVECHAVQKSARGTVLSHGIGGMPYHSVDEGDMKTCTDCHTDPASLHAGTTVAAVYASHPTLDCRVCHIPAIARAISTKTEWYWEDAGPANAPDPIPDFEGRPLWDAKKGTFVYERDVRPALLRFDGKWNRVMIGENDQYTEAGTKEDPVVLAIPSASPTGGGMIYPFKKMIGNQVADAGNNTMLVPHLFGMAGGPNPYWVAYDWDLALQDGAARTGQTYTGAFEFVYTLMYLTVNHEIAPKEEAYGFGGTCNDCHGGGQIDWAALGRTDPLGP